MSGLTPFPDPWARDGAEPPSGGRRRKWRAGRERRGRPDPYDLPDSHPGDLSDAGPGDLNDPGPADLADAGIPDLADPTPFGQPERGVGDEAEPTMVDWPYPGSVSGGAAPPGYRTVAQFGNIPVVSGGDWGMAGPENMVLSAPGEVSATPAAWPVTEPARPRRSLIASIGMVFAVVGALTALLAGKAGIDAVRHPPATDPTSPATALVPLSSMPSGTVRVPSSGPGSPVCGAPKNPEAPTNVREAVKTPAGVVLVEEIAVDAIAGAAHLMDEASQRRGCQTAAPGQEPAGPVPVVAPLAVPQLAGDQAAYQLNAGKGMISFSVDTIIMQVNPTTVVSVSSQTSGTQPDIGTTLGFARRALARVKTRLGSS